MDNKRTLDPIQLSLDAVTNRLARPTFLHSITPSRLPSQAASDSSERSPNEDPAVAGAKASHHRHSALAISHTQDDVLDVVDLTAPLLLEKSTNASSSTIDAHVIEQLEKHFLGARHAYAKMAAERNFQTFAHGHQDLVLAVDFNYFGTRMVTASSDHKLKVYDKKDAEWVLVESWRAHDAEIVDAKWNGPFMGEIIGSIGEDGCFKLWQEDVTEVPMSGKRFKLVTNLKSTSRAPFMSLDFKNIMQETWLALITRDGMLQVYEPVDQGHLNEWQVMAEHWVCTKENQPTREEEVGFKVAFHKEKLPCWTAVMAGIDRKALSLAVAAQKEVLVFRTDKSVPKRFFLVAKLEGARQIIRDVAWAGGSMRGYDIIATASKDGAIRIYELSTPQSDASASSIVGSSSKSAVAKSLNSTQPRAHKNAPSGIGAGLANAKATVQEEDQESQPGRVKHVVKLADELVSPHGAVWQVKFSQMGDLLLSTGDDGKTRVWKKAVNGHWAEYAEIDVGGEE